MRRELKARTAEAFAPATITNFFAVHYDQKSRDLSHAGATGGGYILSKGAVTSATLVGAGKGRALDIIVDGNAKYDARTTREAVQLLLEKSGKRPGKMRLEQRTQVPIGHGFGASAASAISAVFATSTLLGLDLSKEQIAYFAHAAEIIQQTGLGTVSAAYDGVGAGVIYEPGAPGVAKFRNVKVPAGAIVVTASLAPFRNDQVLSSESAVAKVNTLGTEALSRVMEDPTLECLAESGEWFSDKLDLMRADVRALLKTAKSAGAAYASQNMIGHAMHAIAFQEDAEKVAAALASSALKPRVDVLEIGSTKAGPLQERHYPTVTSSLV
ncbi:MAG: hypothetical protein LYZ69_00330 [Nitrososphaerales archaeon]|nr:hypothetical protein [Nitrososphaerales archaeon]